MGLSQHTIDAVADWKETPNLTDDQRLVVEFADVLSRTPVNMTDDLEQRLQDRFSEKQLVELANNIAWENCRARFNRAFGIEPDGYASASSITTPHAGGSEAN